MKKDEVKEFWYSQEFNVIVPDLNKTAEHNFWGFGDEFSGNNFEKGIQIIGIYDGNSKVIHYWLVSDKEEKTKKIIKGNKKHTLRFKKKTVKLLDYKIKSHNDKNYSRNFISMYWGYGFKAFDNSITDVLDEKYRLGRLYLNIPDYYITPEIEKLQTLDKYKDNVTSLIVEKYPNLFNRP